MQLVSSSSSRIANDVPPIKIVMAYSILQIKQEKKDNQCRSFYNNYSMSLCLQFLLTILMCRKQVSYIIPAK